MDNFAAKNLATLSLAPAVAICAWVSLNPYFFWGQSLPVVAVAGLTILIAIAAFWLGDCPCKGMEAIGFVILATFVVYITVLPKMDGGHIRWVYVLPTLLALAIFRDQRRKQTIEAFTVIFAISIVPSIVVSLLSMAGVDLPFGSMPLANSQMAAADVVNNRYFTVPGALLLSANHLELPWGGVIYRLCGIFDEPGMVGTIGALLLAANRFKLNKLRYVVLLIGGILSFSVAFSILAIVGLLWRAIYDRSLEAVVAAVLVALAAVAVGGIPSFILAAHATTGLRQGGIINNRTLSEMELLLNEYWSSGISTLLFGMGTDASISRGGVSKVYTQILTDYGMVGFAFLGVGYLAITFAIWMRTGRTPWGAVFVALFLLSFYQRPAIWIPYALVIFVCGLIKAGSSYANSPASGRQDI